LAKKGIVYSAFMVIITLILLVSMIIVVISKQNKFDDKSIGEIQIETIKTYQNAEKTLFLIDQAAKYSAYKSIYELAENGGIYIAHEKCGKYMDYQILYGREEYCDSDTEVQFKEVYSKNIDEYLSQIPPANSFALQILEGQNQLKIIGVSKNLIEFPITFTTEQPIQKREVCDIPTLVQPDYSVITCQPLQYSSCEFKPEILQMLEKAQEIARSQGKELIVTSGYRTYEQQAELKVLYPTSAAEASCNAPHIIGDAVDIVLKDTPHMSRDDAGGIAYMGYPERQQLEKIMCGAGFIRWTGEFWHYEYGSKRWEKGKAAGACAMT
jgi:hypothetical protein